MATHALNCIAYREDFVEWAPLIDEIRTIRNHEHEQKEDAIWKWLAIMTAMDALDIRPTSILDIGADTSHLAALLANRAHVEHVTAIDIGRLSRHVCEHPKITAIVDDFYTHAFAPHAFDFIYDSCAIIHFNPQHTEAPNDGVLRAGRRICELLKPGGYFVCTSDILHDCHATDTRGEFLAIANLIQCFEMAGLELVDRAPLPNIEAGKMPLWIKYGVYNLGIVRLVFQVKMFR